MVNISLTADLVWLFYMKNANRLKTEMVEIARNDDIGNVIYLTNNDDIMVVSIYHDGEVLYEEGAVTCSTSRDVVTKLYMKYLWPQDNPYDNVVPLYDEEDEKDKEILDHMNEIDRIEEREEEIREAFSDFMGVLTDTPMSLTCLFGDRASTAEVIDRVIAMIAGDYDIRVYRPMHVNDDDTGEEVYCDYPYDDYIFSYEKKK